MTLRVLNPRHVEGTLQGRHVLAMFIAFFGVIFTVNAVFLVSALSTYSGVVANEPYRKGLAYNARIAAQDRQDRLGWEDAITLAPDGIVTVTVSQGGREPVLGLAISGTVGRPTTGNSDQHMSFVETGPGRYAARVNAMEPGSWVIGIEARRAGAEGEPDYRSRRRLWVKP